MKPSWFSLTATRSLSSISNGDTLFEAQLDFGSATSIVKGVYLSVEHYDGATTRQLVDLCYILRPLNSSKSIPFNQPNVVLTAGSLGVLGYEFESPLIHSFADCLPPPDFMERYFVFRVKSRQSIGASGSVFLRSFFNVLDP